MPGYLIILTGAGVSAESGLGTFRDTDGLWAKFDWRELATPEAFAEDPDRVNAFYNARREGLKSAAPNPAHHALVELEQAWLARGGEFLLITQNVDDLHEKAGSHRLLHMHGELKRMRCVTCEAEAESFDVIDSASTCPSCGEAGGLRPSVVWFGEIPIGLDFAFDELQRCTHFAAIGTSGTVYPAAGFSQVARQAGARLSELNMEMTEVSTGFDEALTGPASEITPVWVKRLLESV